MQALKIPPHLDKNRMNAQRAEYVVIHYCDFFSEDCKELYQVFKRLKHVMGADLQYIFRHFPLENLHPLSLKAAMASQAAKEQGKFWEMYNTIFEREEYVRRDSFLEYAFELGLNINQFEEDNNRSDLLETIIGDYEFGIKMGVNHPATLFINGHRYIDLNDIESIYNACENSVGRIAWI